MTKRSEELLNEIYYNYLESEEYMNDPQARWEPSPFLQAMGRIVAIMLKKPECRQAYEEELTSFGCERERMGFFHGFRRAFQLFSACGALRAVTTKEDKSA